MNAVRLAPIEESSGACRPGTPECSDANMSSDQAREVTLTIVSMLIKYIYYTLWSMDNAMPLISVDNTITIAMSVRDRQRSAEWYSETLGFTLLYHMDDAGWSELQTKTPGVTLGLGEQSEPTPGNSVPVFGVPDIATARKSLEAAGVKFDGETETIEGMVSTATFYDPDGNALMLAQDLSDPD